MVLYSTIQILKCHDRDESLDDIPLIVHYADGGVFIPLKGLLTAS